ARPTACHMFRDLIPQLADRYRLIAPDLPGFGQSGMPARTAFTYTFENIANVIDRLPEVMGLHRFAIYVFDYGAPVGFRLAVRHPDRLTAIISQNGNASEEGLSEGWNPIRAYWQEPSQRNREALRSFLAPETTRWQYTHGVPDVTAISPDGYSLDNFYLARPGADEIQLDLFGGYKSNVALYPTFQNYYRAQKPRFLTVWGKNDLFFLPLGAEAFKRDISGATIRFFDTGHFALETHAKEIAAVIRDFLAMGRAQAVPTSRVPRAIGVDEYDLVVLGSGTGSKVAAWTMAQQGKRVVLIERKYIGGSCHNIACLPSKNIIHSANVASYVRRSNEFGIAI